MKTLNEQYRLIKEDKGHKGMFLTEAKRQFPNYIRNAATFDEAEKVLKQKGVITENFTGLEPINSPFSTKTKEPYETAFEKFLEEAKSPEIKAKEVKAKTVKSQEDTEKAELKKTSDQVEDDLEHMYDNKDDKNPDNLIFDQIMMGYYAEMKDPKNADKTMQELKDIVFKNLAKDPIHYTKDGQFGVKGLGYTTEAPGLGTPKEAKGQYKASGYGDLNEGVEKLRDVLMDMGYTPGVINSMTDENVINSVKNIIYDKDGDEKLEKLVADASPMDEAYQLVNINLKAPKKDREKTEMGEGKIGKNYPDALSGEYEGKSVLTPGADLYDLLKDTLEIAISEDDFVDKITYALTDETSNISSQDEHKLRTWYEKNTEDKDMNIQETKLRRVISTIIREELAKKPLNENVDKRLKEIEAEAAMEAMGSKMEKIMAEIENRQNRLKKLDEDEDLKEMMDKKATSKIQKEIKLLERAKAKVEKIMGRGKGKKVEVIDEMEDAEENPEFGKAAARAEEMYNGGLEIKDILVKFNPRMRNDLERHLKMGFEGSDND